MTTKKFSQMSTKKLQTLIATASDEDKKAIQEVLDARMQVAAQPAQEAQATGPKVVEIEPETPLSPEEEEAIARAEAAQANAATTGTKKRAKVSSEELAALVGQCKANVMHKCQVVPSGMLEWVEGYIAGVIKDERSQRVMYRIKTVDGKQAIKVHDSNMLRIFDEIAEKPATVAAKRAVKTKEPMTEEQIQETAAEARKQIGKTVKFKPFGSDEELNGRIMGLMVDRRGPSFLYRVNYEVLDEEGKPVVKSVHKAYNSTGLVIAEEFDEVGLAINNKQYSKSEPKEPKGPKEIKNVDEQIAKVQKQLEKAETKIKNLKAKLEKLQALKAQGVTATPEAEVEETTEESTDELA